MPRPFEDLQTRTVDAAAAFERGRAQADYDPGDGFDDPDPQELADMEALEEACGCTDPGCPCYGPKRGAL